MKQKSINYGYARLDSTFYTNDGELPTNEVVERSFTEISGMIENTSSQPIFQNSINNQFTAILDKIFENHFIYDKTKKQVLLVRWLNSLSCKLNSISFNMLYLSNWTISKIGNITFNDIPIRMSLIQYEDRRKPTDDEKYDDDDEGDNDKENGE